MFAIHSERGLESELKTDDTKSDILFIFALLFILLCLDNIFPFLPQSTARVVWALMICNLTRQHPEHHHICINILESYMQIKIGFQRSHTHTGGRYTTKWAGWNTAGVRVEVWVWAEAEVTFFFVIVIETWLPNTDLSLCTATRNTSGSTSQGRLQCFHTHALK